MADKTKNNFKNKITNSNGTWSYFNFYDVSKRKPPHFLKYKTTTLKMVKSLKLVDMEASDSITMKEIFGKIQK